MTRFPLCRWRWIVAALAPYVAGCGRQAPRSLNPVLEVQSSGTTSLLQAVSVVDQDVVWVSGHRATYVRTVDGGATWEPGVVPGPDSLQFRDVHALDAERAYLLAAGPGEMSRIYKTVDGGATWTLQFTNDEPRAFYDCMDFWDADNGLAYSDAVDGRLMVIRTSDGGATWEPIPPEALPAARGSEGGFAASGTCLVTHGDRTASIGTGAGDTARFVTTGDRGDTWSAVEVPIVSGSSTSGITSLAFRNEMDGVALGGDIRDTAGYTQNVAFTDDGGETWTVGGRLAFPGAVYGASLVPGTEVLMAVGPRGAAYSADNGGSWTALDSLSYWAVGFAGPTAGWMVGPAGRIVKVRF